MIRIIKFLNALLVANTKVFGMICSGSGISGNPYLVASASLLNEVRNYLTAHYKQTRDITLSNVYRHLACLDFIVVTATSTSIDIKVYTLSITRN